MPQGATSGRIRVTTPAGTAESQGIFVVIQPAQLPVISGFSPSSGPAGTAVDIFGNNFIGTQEVRFNGTPSNQVTVSSNGQIRAQAPAGAGTGPITVITNTGSATSAGIFSVQAVSPLPSISFFNPISGQAGVQISINGTNFVNVQSVRFNGVTAVFSVNSPGLITATVPVGASSGLITVTTAAGSASSVQGFVVIQPSQLPVISSFSPGSGPAGTTVMIDGNNFIGTSSVRFNGVFAPSFTVQSNTRITAQAPANAGTGAITVTTATGIASSPGAFTVTVAVPAAPRITALSPGSGQAGTNVIITGTLLGGATAVRFNGKDAAAFTVQSATQVSAVVPLGASTGPVSVITPAGTAIGPGVFTILPGALPGTRSLKKRTAGGTLPQVVSDVVPVMLRAGSMAFTDELVAERVISGIRILDEVELTVVGRIPKGSATVNPTRVLTFNTVAMVRLEAGVATPPEVYTIEIRGKSVIDGEDYDPVIYSIGVDPAVLIGVDPSSASVRAGRTASFTVLLDRSPGAMSLPVTLSAVDLPDDSMAEFGEPTPTGPSTSLKVRTTPSTPLGEKQFRVRGTAKLQGAPVELRDRKVKLTVKEPRVQLIIDEARQSQTVEAGQTAEYPFTIRRNAFEGPLFVEADRPDFVVGFVQDPANPVEDGFTLKLTTNSELMMDREETIGVRLKDRDGTLMASASVHLKALAVLSVRLQIQDKDDSQVVAGDDIVFPVVLGRSGPSSPVDLVVTNDADLQRSGITASVQPTPNGGTMATLEVMTRTSTPVGRYSVRVEARFRGQFLSSDVVDVLVFGRIRLQTTDTVVGGVPGQTLSTRLRVVQRVGFPGPVPVRVLVNQRPLDSESLVQVEVSPNPVADEAAVSLTIRADDTPGVSNSVVFIPDVQGMFVNSIAFLSVDVR